MPPGGEEPGPTQGWMANGLERRHTFRRDLIRARLALAEREGQRWHPHIILAWNLPT